MAGSYTIYASKANDYDCNTSDSWIDTRNASKGTPSLNPANPRHSVSFNGIGWRFIRTYLEFDLRSVIDPITSMTLYIKGKITPGGRTFIAYGGQSALTDSSNDYTLYLDNGSDALANDIITTDWEAFPLDITNNPPSDPPGYYIIGLIASVDFNNSVDTSFAQVAIENGGISTPYLVINQQGYPYEVSGVAGANITEVSGVAVASITNIMGV